jgi:hypothetical protein
MKKMAFAAGALMLIPLFALILTACPKDNDEENCTDITGEWNFVFQETWDCDGEIETDPEYANGIHANQIDCDISFTGTLRRDFSGIMTGEMTDNSFSISYFDDDLGCTLTMSGTVNAAGDALAGTWEDNCYNSAALCYGERGNFSATKNS